MIVKNESRVIRRCLDSVLPLIDYVCIVDTGSSDGTQELIRQYLQEKSLSGEVLDEPWRDFAYNRSHALAQLRRHSEVDYALMIDADSILSFEPGFQAVAFKNALTADIYDVTLRLGNILYRLPLLISNKLDVRYKGVLHEYLDLGGPFRRERAYGFFNDHFQDGARNFNAKKYQDDAAALETALASETDAFLISRYTFYLAQSYRDCGEKAKALEVYLKRAAMGFWDQEVFQSLYSAARIKEELNHPVGSVIQAYMDAYEACPSRAEGLHGAVRACRKANKFHQGYLLAKFGITLQAPSNALFLEPWVYDYGLLDEFSILSYWVGHYRESFDACLKLLREGKMPANELPRIRQNTEYAVDRLNQPELRKLWPLDS